MTTGTDLGVSFTFHLPPQHIIEARKALEGCRELVRCGRPTRRGTLCGQVRARFMPTCNAHASRGERDAADAEIARLTAAVKEWVDSLTPICHSWPVTDEDRRAVAELAADPDDELRTARRAHDLLYRWQRGICAVCGATKRSDDLVLDHDHHTALVRGWLCRSCNVSEGVSDYGDFAKYRERPPAAMLGVSARYEHPWFGLVKPEMTHAEWTSRSLAVTPVPDAVEPLDQ